MCLNFLRQVAITHIRKSYAKSTALKTFITSIVTFCCDERFGTSNELVQ